MKLSANFSLEELTTTSTGQDNTPTDEHTSKLMYLATYLLQPTRDKWGPVTITSGYRSQKVHDALTKAGYPTSKTSQHLLGEAADIQMATTGLSLETVWDWMCKNLKYGQCILEFHGDKNWIHISLPRIGGNNQQAMTYEDGKYELA